MTNLKLAMAVVNAEDARLAALEQLSRHDWAAEYLAEIGDGLPAQMPPGIVSGDKAVLVRLACRLLANDLLCYRAQRQ